MVYIFNTVAQYVVAQQLPVGSAEVERPLRTRDPSVDGNRRLQALY